MPLKLWFIQLLHLIIFFVCIFYQYRSTNEGDSGVLRFVSQVDALTTEQVNDVKKNLEDKIEIYSCHLYRRNIFVEQNLFILLKH
jgi:hypothetical protein